MKKIAEINLNPASASQRRAGRQKAQLGLLVGDLVIVAAAYYLAFLFRYLGTTPDWQAWSTNFVIFIALAIVVHLLVNQLTGVYTIISRYMSLVQAVRVGQAGILATTLLFIVVASWPLYTGGGDYLVPRSVVIGGGILALIAMIGIRFGRRVAREVRPVDNLAPDRLLVVGAGQAADMLLRELKRTPALRVQVVGLVDDDPSLRSMSIQGFPVLGNVSDIPLLTKIYAVTQVIVAIPSASATEVAHVYRICKPTGLPVKILPSLAELVAGTISLGDARDLEIKDLLGRPQIETDVGRISDFIQGQTVLVTGAAGSIGSELCRQLARFDPGRLVLIDHDESSLYNLHEQLQSQGFTRYVLCPSNILQAAKLEKVFALHRPRVVFHAAAYKHVPLMELSPDEAILNNMGGTLLAARTAAKYGVERFVNISTDKAVAPANVMGATKRAGELIVRAMGENNPDTLFASVRFGNVLGSQGSVIPIFKRQIETGGPLFITHPEMTRYFMLIEEAVQLLIQAAVMVDDEHGLGERSLGIFVLEMGDPVSIVDLAQQMIEFYWRDQSRSIGVEFSGLRPGEKLEECLLYDYEEALPTSHRLVKRVSLREGAESQKQIRLGFADQIRGLINLAQDHADKDILLSALMMCVPDYVPLDKAQAEKLISVV